MILRFTVACLASVCTLASQEILWRRVGRPIGDPRGSQVLYDPLLFSDINGDGYCDVLCPTRRLDLSSNSLLFVSGRDGSLLREYVAVPPEHWFQRVVACGDVDRDGIEDYAVNLVEMMPPFLDAFIEVRSGVNDRLIWSVRTPRSEGLGRSLLGNVDLNGDGRLDLVVAHTFNPGALEGFDHMGRSLFRLPIHPWQLGHIGDFDGDGCDDFLLGASDQMGQGGAVYIYSGRTQRVLAGGCCGIGTGTVLGLGDIDGDGLADYAGSAHGGFGTPGRVSVFSGRAGRLLYEWREAPSTGFGYRLAACDFDQDGVVDLAMSSFDDTRTYGVIRAHSMRDGRQVGIIDMGGPPYVSIAGNYRAGPGKRPGDPFAVVLTEEYEYVVNNWQVGRITLFRTAPANVRVLGSGCVGLPSSRPHVGYRSEANGARIQLTGANEGAVATLLLGASGSAWRGSTLPWRLDGLGFVGCSLNVSVEATAVRVLGGGLDAGSASVLLPRAPTFVYGQWAIWDPRSGQFSMSAGLRW